MKKNIMPLLLAVCMTASSLPVTAMAGDTVEAGQEEMADGSGFHRVDDLICDRENGTVAKTSRRT